MCPGVLRDIAPALSRDQILVSVIAGFPLSLLCEPLPEHAKVIRSMPNTPMLVGQGKFRNGIAIVLIDANFFKPLSIKIRQKLSSFKEPCSIFVADYVTKMSSKNL